MQSVDELATAAHPRPGAVLLGRYRLVHELGAGGMGVVWLGHDERLDREVAVKHVPTGGAAGPARAQREALAAARLAHPAIVALYEAAQEGEALVLVSEFVRGRTLGSLLAEGELSDRDVLRIGVTLCDALAHAHVHGVVHRDVKPGNVLCPEAHGDGSPVAKLTDFGVAHLAEGEPLTRTGDVVGTLAYMAPEQAAGEAVGPATDVYALALVLHEALTGTNPVRGASAAQTVRRLGTRLPALQGIRRDLPRGLCRALDEALDPEPQQRPDLGALRAALLGAQHLVA
ncbi:MAG: serine/threonine protein kinase, partial [Solirubrobacterales bacterium]|nr:serine/threonine protein kinase [Solirubrobacterales bacterium]